MAALSLRLRRALALSSSLLKDRHFSSLSPSPPPPLAPPKPYSPLVGNPNSKPTHSLIQAQSFRSSASLNCRFDQNEKEFGPDDILFEGCDYQHWLITMDFPKDPEQAPSREEMIETYVQTAAKVFGSVEEAKKRIYALSTTTYHGFQCLMDEATSEKFKGLPGVVFILPDSYIDPVNKEYGGDKYEDGVITPRPPPVQYGRGRYNDRNRNYDQPRQRRYGDRNMNYDQQGSASQDGRGFGSPPQDGRGFGPPPQDGRDFGPPPKDGRGFGPPLQDGRGFGLPPQDGRGYGQPQQDGRGYGQPPQDGRGYGQPPRDGRGYGQPPRDGRGYGQPPQDGRGYGQPPQDGRGYGQPPQDGRGYGQPPQDGTGYSQAPQDGTGYGQPPQDDRGYSQVQKNFSSQGQGGDYRPGPAADYRQSSGPGFAGEPRQGSGTGYNGDNRQGTESGYAGDYKQGPGFSHGPSPPGPVEEQWQPKY